MPQGCIRGTPKLFETEFCFAEVGRGNRGAFQCYFVCFDGIKGIVSDLIIVIVTALDREIEGLQLNIDVRQNQLEHGKKVITAWMVHLPAV